MTADGELHSDERSVGETLRLLGVDRRRVRAARRAGRHPAHRQRYS